MTASRSAALALLLTLAPTAARADDFWDTTMAEVVGKALGEGGFGAHWNKVLALEGASAKAEARTNGGREGAATPVGVETLVPLGAGRDFRLAYAFERPGRIGSTTAWNPLPGEGELVSMDAYVNPAFGRTELTIVEVVNGKAAKMSFASRPLIKNLKGQPLVTVRYEMRQEQRPNEGPLGWGTASFSFLLGGPDGKVKTPGGAMLQRVAGFLFRVADALAQPSARERDAGGFLRPARSHEMRRALVR